MSVQTAQRISVRQMNAEDRPLLEQMYNSYAPLGDTLGLPPPDPIRRRDWLEDVGEGINLVAYVDGHRRRGRDDYLRPPGLPAQRGGFRTDESRAKGSSCRRFFIHMVAGRQNELRGPALSLQTRFSFRVAGSA